MALTDNRYKKPAMWKHPNVLRKRILRSWPVLVWLLAIVAVLYFYQGAGRLTAITGVVDTVSEPVAPLETARLLTTPVALGQSVKAGEVVATMDTLLFDAETAVDEAQLIEVEGTLQDYQQRILGFVRDFERDKSDAQFELDTQILEQKRDASVLAVLKTELARLEDLKKKGLVSEQDLASLRPDIASLEQTVAAYPGLVEINQRRLTDATDDERTMRSLLEDETDANTDVRFDILATIREMRKATDEIILTSRKQRKILRESYALRASRDGIISQIFHHPGDVVPAGEPIMRIVAGNTERVIAFLPEMHLGDVRVGETVGVWRQTGGGERITATVESIAPEIDTLPTRISPIRNVPLRGRRMVLHCSSGHDLLPGETVRVEMTPPGTGLHNWLNKLMDK